MSNFDSKTFTVPAGASYVLTVAGSFFKITAAPGRLKVKAEFGTLDGITVGQGVTNSPYTSLIFQDRSGSDQVVTLIHGEGDFIDSATSIVTVAVNKTPQVTLVDAEKTVTSTSSTLLAANANRQSLAIQNKDSSGTIWITFGATALVGKGFKISPGGFWEPALAVHVGAIKAIGDIASNANIVVTEG
jgi:hypothetical protein